MNVGYPRIPGNISMRTLANITLGLTTNKLINIKGRGDQNIHKDKMEIKLIKIKKSK